MAGKRLAGIAKSVIVTGNGNRLTEGVALIDADTGRWRVIRKVEPPLENRVSGDGRTLLVERPSIEEDLWLVDFRK